MCVHQGRGSTLTTCSAVSPTCSFCMSYIHLSILAVSCERGRVSVETELSRIVNGVGYSENVPVCQACPLDTYSDTLGSPACLSCPKYHTTDSTGATSIHDCLRKSTDVSQNPRYSVFHFVFQRRHWCWSVVLVPPVAMSPSTARPTDGFKRHSALSMMASNTCVCTYP